MLRPLLDRQAISVRMRGIEIMNNDPKKAKILYAKVESKNEILQRLVDEVATFYAHDGK